MRTFLAAIFVLLCSTIAQSQTVSPKLQAAMQTTNPVEKIAVIIELSEQTNLRSFAAQGRFVRQLSTQERREQRSALIRTLKSKADLSQGGVRSFLRSKGVATQKSLWINNSIAVEISPELIQQLVAMPEVASIRTDAAVSLPEIVPAATGGVEDNLLTIKVPDLWDLGLRGQGTVIALLDSGVDYLHSDLNPSWRGGSNSWFNPIAADCALNPGSSCTSCDLSADLPCDFVDTDGIAHGTGIAGIMVGGDAGGTAIGVAPQAQWIAAKIFKSDGTAKTSNIHLAFQWALDPDDNPGTDDAPDVVNVSWVLDSPGGCFDEFRPDVQTLEAAGIAPVLAAGNSGPAASTDDSPANYPESLSVGSIGSHTSTLEISDFSGRGPSSCDGAIYPKLVAPGFAVKTADYTSGGTLPDSYTPLAGTSFSAPQVAGILALLTQAFPQAPLIDLEDALTQSAQDLGDPGPDNDYGYGLVDAAAAYDRLQQKQNVAGNSPSPAPSLVSPASGASNVALPVEVTWRQLPDPDGDQVTNRLYVSTDSSFSDTLPIQATAQKAGTKLLSASIGGLLLTGLLIRGRRKSSLLSVLLLTTVLVILVSCGGGGGGGGGSSSTDSTLHSYSLAGLSPQTTYYWKVSADDGHGNTVESSVASFTTE